MYLGCVSMKNINLILADTYRSKVYLQAISQITDIKVRVVHYIRNNLRPTDIKAKPATLSETKLLKSLHPELKNFLYFNMRSIEEISITNKFEYHKVSVSKGIHDIPKSYFSLGCNIFSGYPSEIVPKYLTDQYILLHAHGGILPTYKGSTTNYYSKIEKNIIGASLIVLSDKLDAGKVLNVYFEKITKLIELDFHLDNALRAKVVFDYLSSSRSVKSTETLGGRMYYVAHPVIRKLALETNFK